MRKLIVRSGLSKQAAPEDGPSFEQQFGILANAVVVDKFPQLDKMRLAFQMIDKEDDNSKAVGVVVYLIGKSVVFVPAFFKRSKLIAGDMMFLTQTNQFVPLSDAWINWVRQQETEDAGELLPEELAKGVDSAKATVIKELNDPITKTAKLYLRGLLRASDDICDGGAGTDMFSAALGMGKRASEALLDDLIRRPSFLNATLTFYSGDRLNEFAKRAAAMDSDLVKAAAPRARIIMPLDKEAKYLEPAQLDELYRDGYIICKTAAASEDSPAVVKAENVSNRFAKVDGTGRMKLLTVEGNVKAVTVLRTERLTNDAAMSAEIGEFKFNDCANAAEYMEKTFRHDRTGFVAVTEKGMAQLPPNVMYLRGTEEPLSGSYIKGIGRSLSACSSESIPQESYFVLPDGTCYKWMGYTFEPVRYGSSWSNGHATLTVSSNPELRKAIVTTDSICLPKGTRVVLASDGNDEKDAPVAYVTLSMMPTFLSDYCRKRYSKVKVYSDGNTINVTGDRTPDRESSDMLTQKEAALRLVTDYGVSPDDAKLMLKEASVGASYSSPRAVSFMIQKAAAEDPLQEPADLPMNEVRNVLPKNEQREMPQSLTDTPEQMTQAVIDASKSGIKEVFDVTAIKLLVRQSQLFDDIQEDMPLFMRVLDSLCKKLFQFYWHTDRMEEKYGLVKMKSLEDSLKTAIDNMSELTIFFKQRTVDASGITGDADGELTL